eukprot:TRINITY_DN9079_c0_g1_i3.p1 TRINITY_DN9079_c0_g1~~TRINITY_DN9079_c0_g1_i3.p1  ORF type:complete len:270 (+),score=47.84 TRINITY_DN9079_c0_g1_i3:120-929(+)
MRRRPPRSTLSSSSAASDVYKRQEHVHVGEIFSQSLFGKADLLVKLLKGASSRVISVEKAGEFKSRIHFADIANEGGIYFHLPSSATDEHGPFAALRVLGPPKVDQSCASAVALVTARYPSWVVLKFNSADLRRFKEDVETVQELQVKLTDVWPPNLNGDAEPHTNTTRDTDLGTDEIDMFRDLTLTDHSGSGDTDVRSTGLCADICAVCRVLVLDRHGSVLSCGSAVCVDADLRLLLTAAHVVVSPRGKWDCSDAAAGCQILIAPQTR